MNNCYSFKMICSKLTKPRKFKMFQRWVKFNSCNMMLGD